MRGAKCVESASCEPPNPTLTTGRPGKDFGRSHLTMLELPAKKMASAGGGFSFSRFSMATTEDSHFEADFSSAADGNTASASSRAARPKERRSGCGMGRRLRQGGKQGFSSERKPPGR